MKVNFEANSKTVYQVTAFDDGTVQVIKIRDCNTEAEAKALANYYRVRRG